PGDFLAALHYAPDRTGAPQLAANAGQDDLQPGQGAEHRPRDSASGTPRGRYGDRSEGEMDDRREAIEVEEPEHAVPRVAGDRQGRGDDCRWRSQEERNRMKQRPN